MRLLLRGRFVDDSEKLEGLIFVKDVDIGVGVGGADGKNSNQMSDISSNQDSEIPLTMHLIIKPAVKTTAGKNIFYF